MKKLATLLFVFQFILFVPIIQAQKSNKPKTSTFYQYQQSQAFKGIKFGSSLNDVSSKMNLSSDYSDKSMLAIKNQDYLKFDIYQFSEGEAYFTNSGQLYQVVISINDTYPACLTYKKIGSRLIELFGGNDAEYTYDPNDKSNQNLNISWRGTNLYINLMISPENSKSNKGRVSLTILHEKLNALHLEELPKTPNGIPSI